MQWLNSLNRLEHTGIPIYIDSKTPDWFVPSTRIDVLLRAVRKYDDTARALAEFCHYFNEEPTGVRRDLNRLQNLLGQRKPQPYLGRSHYLRLGALKEIWFHLTDACNLSCIHCLFASSPAEGKGLEQERLRTAIDQAAALGARLFCFTGGEPFVYPNFCDTIQYVLELHPANHVAVLTNGLLLEEHIVELMLLDNDRLHLQVSLDGTEEEHNFFRGPGTYSQLRKNLQVALESGLAFTISVAVNADNVHKLEEIARQAHALGACGLHLMYHFVRGKGTREQVVPLVRLFAQIVKTVAVCRELGMRIDNIEALKAQVFADPGSRFDLTNMGWESLAVAPDGKIYPSPALIRVEELVCGSLDQGLEQVWRNNPMLERIRSATHNDLEEWLRRPLSLITGGGAPDHSWITGHALVGYDPYIDLYEQFVLQLIVEQARLYPDQGLFRLRMGDVRHDGSDTDNDFVGLTHCNYLLSLADNDGCSLVREFYSSAARKVDEEIVNPFGLDVGLPRYIPEESQRKSYVCGSPIKDAVLQAGETVVDLGSGSGLGCFLASAEVGSAGSVYGIDKTDEMLELARRSKRHVVTDLGYDNIEFRKGCLEAIPLEDACADVVISNRAINYSLDKRRTFLEILRILKPGGRLVVADVVSDESIATVIKNSGKYSGESLGGTMLQEDLVTMLEDCGFVSVYLHKRCPYREVDGNLFYSLTYEAGKEERMTEGERRVRCIYRGPAPVLETASGERLERGRITWMPVESVEPLGEQVFMLNDLGAVTNVEQEACCYGVAEKTTAQPDDTSNKMRRKVFERHLSGCMVCGEELLYQADEAVKMNCACVDGHFVCDICHQEEGVEVVRNICLNSKEKDMFTLFRRIRSHPAVPMHGPEHHSMVPGVILTAYRNNNGGVSRDAIAIGIDRGGNVSSGACGFWGACGAAVGAGIAASLILEATPLTPDARQQSQEFTARILKEISRQNGARCCQRESWLALTHAARLSEEFFGATLPAETVIHCDQYEKNQGCTKGKCPLWETRDCQEIQKTLQVGVS
ncbi:MAG: methyltransferase domain-containing protein [Candidatus Electrothrix sp. AR4]|nr:methyltransferase domain-containing protein [Candidatus Electrothrix sp. AR4]